MKGWPKIKVTQEWIDDACIDDGWLGVAYSKQVYDAVQSGKKFAGDEFTIPPGYSGDEFDVLIRNDHAVIIPFEHYKNNKWTTSEYQECRYCGMMNDLESHYCGELIEPAGCGAPLVKVGPPPYI